MVLTVDNIETSESKELLTLLEKGSLRRRKL